MRKGILLFIVVAVLFVTGCAPQGSSPEEIAEVVSEEADVPSETVPVDWKSVGFVDASTGETFTITQFAGTPVLVESFAVWCPKCLRQQEILSEFKQQSGDAVVIVSLDTDPNEDLVRVQEHLARYGFDWYFAVSPSDVTQALIAEFGLEVVSAPSTPIILVCADQSTRFLESGEKSLEELATALEQGC